MRLFPKFIGWAALNIVWLGVVLIISLTWLFFGADGRFPHTLFQGGINQAMMVVAVHLQYKSPGQWPQIMESYSQSYGVRFMVYSLDANDPLPDTQSFPPEVLLSAQKIPRPQTSLCPDPLDAEYLSLNDRVEAESGFLPSQNAVFLKSGSEYWYGRPVFIPDDSHIHRYVLLAAVAPSVNGDGLFFDITIPLSIMALSLGLSFLWWWPFVLHLTVPLLHITRTAERIASGDYSQINIQDESKPLFSLTRKDEIGRLAGAVESMSAQLMRQMFGQRRFIRHIAHELGAPLARAKFGLAVLEDRLDPENAHRVGLVGDELEQVSSLVEDVLTYLRAEGVPSRPSLEVFALEKTLKELTEVEAGATQVEVVLPDRELYVRADRECLQRAVGNVLRNAVRYASEAGPIVVSAQTEGREVRITVQDSGPGVFPEELVHLTEPFFRGEGSGSHPGGSGLGLSIVKYCVESCHGHLTFCNAESGGLCVSLYFPDGGTPV